MTVVIILYYLGKCTHCSLDNCLFSINQPKNSLARMGPGDLGPKRKASNSDAKSNLLFVYKYNLLM